MHLALFDFDGTLTDRDTFTLFVLYATNPWRKRIGGVLIAPIYLLYRLNLISASRMRRCVVWAAFKGRCSNELTKLAETFSEDVIPQLLRPEAMAWLLSHKQAGDSVYVVSASLSLYLAPWCEKHGISLLSSELQVHNTRITGRYARRDCCGKEKVERVKHAIDLTNYKSISAYGDTPEDYPMLSLASKQVYQGKVGNHQ